MRIIRVLLLTSQASGIEIALARGPESTGAAEIPFWLTLITSLWDNLCLEFTQVEASGGFKMWGKTINSNMMKIKIFSFTFLCQIQVCKSPRHWWKENLNYTAEENK